MVHKAKIVCAVLLISLLLSACGKENDVKGFSVAAPDAVSQTSAEQKVSASDTIDASTDEQRDDTLQPASPVDDVEDEVKRPEKGAEVLEIREKMFLTQIDDMYFNFDLYKDKTIVVEGMYTELYAWDETEKVPAVYRRGPGCCGNDGWGGFLLNYDGEYPVENAWIRVTGTPEMKKNGHYLDLYLNVISIEEKTERGAEFVMQ